MCLGRRLWEWQQVPGKLAILPFFFTFLPLPPQEFPALLAAGKNLPICLPAEELEEGVTQSRAPTSFPLIGLSAGR